MHDDVVAFAVLSAAAVAGAVYRLAAFDVDIESVAVTGATLSLIAGLYWKVWSDNTATSRERKTLEDKCDDADARAAAAESRATRYQTEIDTLRRKSTGDYDELQREVRQLRARLGILDD